MSSTRQYARYSSNCYKIVLTFLPFETFRIQVLAQSNLSINFSFCSYYFHSTIVHGAGAQTIGIKTLNAAIESDYVFFFFYFFLFKSKKRK